MKKKNILFIILLLVTLSILGLTGCSSKKNNTQSTVTNSTEIETKSTEIEATSSETVSEEMTTQAKTSDKLLLKTTDKKVDESGIVYDSTNGLIKVGEFADNTLNIHFLNETGKTIYELYITETSNNSWGNELLGTQIIPNEKTADIHYNSTVKDKLFDICVVDNKNVIYYAYGVDLLSNSSFSASITNNNLILKPYTAESGSQSGNSTITNANTIRFSIWNNTQNTIREAYIIPDTSSSWTDAKNIISKDVNAGETVSAAFEIKDESLLSQINWKALFIDQNGQKIYTNSFNIWELSEFDIFHENDYSVEVY